MLSSISKIVLKILGWKLDVTIPKEKKFILIGAPHTSNWDLPLGLLTFWTLDVKIYWVAKIQMFRGPLHYFFTALGGIPVDRTASHGFINQIAEKIKQTDKMALAISPEGTRSKTKYWKSGFYYIAMAANIPICLGYLNYKDKTLGFKTVLYPSGNIDADMKIIADFYANIEGKRPEHQGPIRLKNR